MIDFDVKLKSNGKYWQAYWTDPAARGKRFVKSMGAKSKISRRQAGVLCRRLAVDLILDRRGAKLPVDQTTHNANEARQVYEGD